MMKALISIVPMALQHVIKLMALNSQTLIIFKLPQLDLIQVKVIQVKVIQVKVIQVKVV